MLLKNDGGLVNVEYTTNLIDGLRQYPWVQLNEKLVEIYELWSAAHLAYTGGSEWASEPWNQDEMPLDDALVKEAAAVSNKAVIVLGRTAGEDRDNGRLVPRVCQSAALYLAWRAAMRQRMCFRYTWRRRRD